MRSKSFPALPNMLEMNHFATILLHYKCLYSEDITHKKWLLLSHIIFIRLHATDKLTNAQAFTVDRSCITIADVMKRCLYSDDGPCLMIYGCPSTIVESRDDRLMTDSLLSARGCRFHRTCFFPSDIANLRWNRIPV